MKTIAKEPAIRETVSETAKSLQENYPSVELAYPIAIASYETALKRLDALDNRVQTLMTFAATVMLAVPAVAANKGLSFKSGWFITALVLFLIANAFGIAARLRGHICLLSPETLYNEYLGLSEWEFKKDAIYWAGVNFKHNNNLILHRHRLMVMMLIFFLLEVEALAVWVAATLS